MPHQSSRRPTRSSRRPAVAATPVATASFVRGTPVRRKAIDLSLDALWTSRLRRTEIFFEAPAFKEFYVDCHLG